jgi:DNA-binding XRE family transcriptional regulator
MLARTKKHRIDRKTVPLCFMVHPKNVAKIRALVAEIEPEAETASPVSAEEFFDRNFSGQSRGAVHLKGLRYREALTQVQLAGRTGIPQRHISEMENGKRPISKAAAHKLAAALGLDYRLLL